MEAFETADGEYQFDQIINGKTLRAWVDELTYYNNEKNGWNQYKLKPGSYGFETYAYPIGYVLTHTGDTPDLVHQAWSKMYTYWVENEPWNRELVFYKGPYNPLGDERRNMCASTDYIDLPESERVKDDIIAEWMADVGLV